MGFILNYFLIVFLVIEIAVVLMRSTGLDREIARFQVVSLMTSTGFTTKESELILGHPLRRRIGIFLIIFGVFSFAVIISSISSILVPDFKVMYLAYISAGLAVLLIAIRLPVMQEWIRRRFEKPLNNKYEIHELPIEVVMLQEDTDFFVDIPIGDQSPIIGNTIDHLCGSDTDVNLLFIKRGTVQIRKDRGRTPVEAGDVLFVYGGKGDIRRFFERELRERDELRKQEIESKSLV